MWSPNKAILKVSTTKNSYKLMKNLSIFTISTHRFYFRMTFYISVMNFHNKNVLFLWIAFYDS